MQGWNILDQKALQSDLLTSVRSYHIYGLVSFPQITVKAYQRPNGLMELVATFVLTLNDLSVNNNNNRMFCIEP